MYSIYFSFAQFFITHMTLYSEFCMKFRNSKVKQLIQVLVLASKAKITGFFEKFQLWSEEKTSKNIDFSLLRNRQTSSTYTIFPFLTHCASLQQLSIRGRRGLTSNKSFKSLPCQVFWQEASKKSSSNCCYDLSFYILFCRYRKKLYSIQVLISK